MPPETAKPASSPNITLVRRNNLLALLRNFMEVRMAAGARAAGLELEFSEQLQVHHTLLSQLKSSRPISEKMARQIEARCSLGRGWLDSPRETIQPTASEERFIELCRLTWRSLGAKQRRALVVAVKGVVREGQSSWGLRPGN
jgi:hypothetical protein